MKGIELCRAYYEAFGAPMIHTQFPEWEDKIAVGIAGSGSDCYGFDDDISRDHDFEPGFCLFVPEENVLDRRTCFLLERAYEKLPREFMGTRRSPVSPVGGARKGVIRCGDFWEEKTGSRTGTLTDAERLALPDFYLFEATDGEIFRDDAGTFTAVRRALAAMPENVRKKKLAGYLLTMAQAGPYNYARCLSHGETAAAQMAVFEFCRAAMQVVFLLNARYMPYYKWSFRALRSLPLLSNLSETLEYLMTSDNDAQTAETKRAVIEDVAALVISVLREQNLTKADCTDLEKHAYSVNDGVEDHTLRNLHILAGVTP